MELGRPLDRPRQARLDNDLLSRKLGLKVAERNRVIVEGASACAVTAALSGRAGAGKVVAIASGGNIDLDKFAQLVAQV